MWQKYKECELNWFCDDIESRAWQWLWIACVSWRQWMQCWLGSWLLCVLLDSWLTRKVCVARLNAVWSMLKLSDWFGVAFSAHAETIYTEPLQIGLIVSVYAISDRSYCVRSFTSDRIWLRLILSSDPPIRCRKQASLGWKRAAAPATLHLRLSKVHLALVCKSTVT